jgi:predicted outer membrane repeat protein
MTLSIGGSRFVGNRANEGGGAIFFVSDDLTGTMAISDSTLERNPNDRFHTAGLPGIFFLGARRPTITGSVLR